MRGAIDVARFVLSGIQLHLGPLVVDVSYFGLVEDFLDERRWDEVESASIAKYDVPRHDRGITDFYGNVEARKGHALVIQRGWMGTSIVNRHVDREDPLHIANAAVHHETGMGGIPDSCCQVVAHDSASI